MGPSRVVDGPRETKGCGAAAVAGPVSPARPAAGSPAFQVTVTDSEFSGSEPLGHGVRADSDTRRAGTALTVTASGPSDSQWAARPTEVTNFLNFLTTSTMIHVQDPTQQSDKEQEDLDTEEQEEDINRVPKLIEISFHQGLHC
jgi:hypothetical protein